MLKMEFCRRAIFSKGSRLVILTAYEYFKGFFLPPFLFNAALFIGMYYIREQTTKGVEVYKIMHDRGS